MSDEDVKREARNEILDRAEALKEWRKQHVAEVEKMMDGILSLVKDSFIDLEKAHKCPVSARKLRMIHQAIGSVACQALGEIEGVPFEPAAPPAAPQDLEPAGLEGWPQEHPAELLAGEHEQEPRLFQQQYMNQPVGAPDATRGHPTS